MDNGLYRILLVEDNPEHLSFQKKSVGKLGDIKKIETARSAKEALELLSSEPFDLMVLDYDLPDTDGLSFLESLVRSGIDIAVVMVTGLGNEKIAVRAMKLGAYDYIVKDRDLLKNLPVVIKRSLDKYILSMTLRNTERQLRESEERFKQLYQNANSGFVSIDINTGRFLKPNKKMIEITGFSKERLENMFLCDLVSSEEKDRIQGYRNNWLAGRNHKKDSPMEFEMKIETGGEKEKHVNVTVSIFREIGEIFLTLNDISDRIELEEKLRNAHEQLKKHTKKLEKKVDQLEKSLSIEPILESPTDKKQRYKLDFGCSYLIKEERPEKSYLIFRDMVSHGVFGLVITRNFPARIQKTHHLEKTPVVWLSKNGSGESSISGTNLGSLLYTIAEFIEKSKKSVIILDGLEYLITVNEFDRCIQFMNDFFEMIMINEAALIIPINPDAVEKKELAILERSTEEIKDTSYENGDPDYLIRR